MPRGRPVTPLTLSESEESELGSLARSRTLPHSLVLRAQIVLACAEGVPGSTVARRLGVTNTTVGKWRKRYREHGIPGLHDELRPGRPRTHEDERVAEVINTALQTEPPDRSHWSVRSMAETHGSLKEHGPAVVRSVRRPAASPAAFQDFQRPVLRRESPRHRRSLPQSPGPRRGALGR